MLIINYHLALIATLHGAKWKLTTCTIHGMYMKLIKLTQTERKLAVDCLVQCLPEVMLSIMALTFENGNYI